MKNEEGGGEGGGERRRNMVTLNLLFSILLSSLSPFYVLTSHS